MGKTKTKIHLLLIDPQLDFCDHPDFAGSLAVPGAHADLSRVAAMIRSMGSRLADIHVTLDSHHAVDIAHPIWWRDASGAAPAPFTPISAAQVEAGVWSARNPAFQARSLEYVRSLEAGGRYGLVIWPEHCLIGTRGHGIHPEVMDALLGWDRANFAAFEAVTKGSNPFTEHYSGVRAEVPDPADPSTQLNMGLVKTLAEADLVLVAGEALSHCVANTVRDVAANFDAGQVAKIVLLEDAASSVPGFESQAAAFVAELSAKGMRVARTTDF